MALLHGEPVLAGDSVYDVSASRGSGRVERIVSGSIECVFGTVRAIYGSDGKQKGGSRVTLYWHNPIVEIPAKDHAVWASQIKISQFVKSELLKMRQQ